MLLYNQTVYNDQQLELANGLMKVHIDCVMFPAFLPPGVQPQWNKQPGNALGESSRGCWSPGATSYWLYFDTLLPEQHSGTYTCSVGLVQASFKLKVLPASKAFFYYPGTLYLNVSSASIAPAPPTRTPTLVSDIQNLTLPPRRLAQFTCIMKGLPVPQITWLHNQQTVVSSTNVQLIQQNLSDASMSIIIINSVSQSNAGTYVCTGSNSAGTTQATATLTVTGEYLKDLVVGQGGVEPTIRVK